MSTINIEDYIAKYGSELGETFFYVHTHWCRLFTVFSQYANLFGKSKHRVDLLNQSAGPFFKTVQDTFHDEILLAICRLTDPAQSMKKIDPNKNVSVLRLALLLEQHTIGPNVLILANNAVSDADFAREQRNKKISHSDLEIVSGKSFLETGASIVQMRQSIRSIHKVIFTIGENIGGVHMVSSVIGSRTEFSLLKLLFEANKEQGDLRARNFEKTKKDYNFEYYPNWLFDEDEETNWY